MTDLHDDLPERLELMAGLGHTNDETDAMLAAAAELRRLAAENAELRARLERVEAKVDEMETGMAPLVTDYAKGVLDACDRIRAALDGGGEMGEGGE